MYFILASKSPRRLQLLKECGLDFAVVASQYEEVIDSSLDIKQAIIKNALGKAKDVLTKYPNDIIVGCDTVVVYQNQLLGKPKNRDDAKTMLETLSGKTHEVISGVAIISKDKEICFYEKSKVNFYQLEDSLLESYLDSDEPYDKAGAYGIQGKGRLFVSGIEGDYYNIVGLPIARLYRELNKFAQAD